MNERTAIPSTEPKPDRVLPIDRAEKMRRWVADDKERTDAEAASRAEMTNLMRRKR
jgi:hypothetical protein